MLAAHENVKKSIRVSKKNVVIQAGTRYHKHTSTDIVSKNIQDLSTSVHGEGSDEALGR
jgi:hypothetical protein